MTLNISLNSPKPVRVKKTNLVSFLLIIRNNMAAAKSSNSVSHQLAVSGKQDDEDDTIFTCPVCQEPSQTKLSLLCKHNFCYPCIKQMLMSVTCPPACPLCRSPVDRKLINTA